MADAPERPGEYRYALSTWTMPKTRAIRAAFAVATGSVFLVAAAARAAQAQLDSSELRPAQTAALPESNEAMLLAGRAGEAVKRGDFRLAIQLIEQITNLPDALVADPDSPVYYPVWRQARLLLSALPPDGLTYYRQIVDPEAAASFREAIESSDVERLRKLFREYPASSVAPRIGSELVSRLMESGDYAQAVDTLHELGSSDDEDDRFARRARLVVALAQLGAWQSSIRLLDSLEADPMVAANPPARQRVARLRAWVENLRESGISPAHAVTVALSPALAATSTWERSLSTASDAAYMDDDAGIVTAIDEFRRLPLIEPIIAGDMLIVRLRGQLWAHDALSLTRRWQAAEILTGIQARAGEMPRFGQAIAPAELDVGGAPTASPQTRNLLSHSLRHAVSVSLGNVYTIEGLTPMRDPSRRQRFRGRLFRGRRERTFANELVAREIATGKQVWRIPADTSDPLHGVAFQDAPIAVGDQLAVPIQRDDDIFLCVLDPATGRLLREIPIVGPPTVFDEAGGRCLIVRDDTTIYVCTGNGIIAAISSATWEWKWAAAYASTLGKQLASRIFFRADFGSPGLLAPTRPIIAGDLLVLAPIDSNAGEIMGIDRFSGRIRWRVDRSDYVAIVGAIDDRLILCGNTVTCVDLADGATVHWRSIPIELSGRPAIHGRRVYVPARDALLVLDADTGKIVDDRLYPAGDPGVGNLAVSEDALFSVSPARIIKYPDIAATRSSCAALIEARRDDPRARLTLAWVDMLASNYQSALEMIEAMGPADAAIEAEREELLVRLFVALSREAPAGQDKLSWLRRAESLSQSSKTAGQMGMLIGRALEEAGRIDDALSHYRGMLLTADSPMLTHAGRRVVGWLHAAQRIRGLLPAASEEQRAEWTRGLLESFSSGQQTEGVMQRAMLAIDDACAVQQLSRAILVQSHRPEIAIDYLPEGDDPSLPLAERRRVHLSRWETHLSLGMIEAAEEDREHWREALAIEVPASQPVAGESIEAKQLARIKKLETARRKLRDFRSASPEFRTDVSRRWALGKVRDNPFQLLLDRRSPRSVMRPWLLIRDLSRHELQLRNAVLGTKLRQTSAATISGALPGILDAESADRFAFGDFDHREAGAPPVWPGVYHGHKAVIPVRGGLVCVGLGPERGGGTRLWEHEIAQPFDIVSDFSDRAVGGADGFYFAHREDRIVCLGWPDGKPRWEREFADLRVQRLFLTGNHLVVIGQNREIIVLNARFGDEIRRPPPTLPTPDWVTVVGDTVILASGRSLLGLSARALEHRWNRSCDSAVAGWFAIPGQNWIAYRELVSDKWTVIDAVSGREKFIAEIPSMIEVSAAAVVGQRLLVAGVPGNINVERRSRRAVLAAIDVESGRSVWRKESASIVPVNLTQLIAHPRYIPILTAGGSDWWDDDSPDLGIELLDRRTGERVGKRIAITKGFANGRDAAQAYMLVTPSRMIVAAGGRLAAYGTSRLGSSGGN